MTRKSEFEVKDEDISVEYNGRQYLITARKVIELMDDYGDDEFDRLSQVFLESGEYAGTPVLDAVVRLGRSVGRAYLIKG